MVIAPHGAPAFSARPSVPATIQHVDLWDLERCSADFSEGAVLVIISAPPGAQQLEGIVDLTRRVTPAGSAIWVVVDDGEVARDILGNPHVEDAHVTPLHEPLFWEKVRRRLQGRFSSTADDQSLQLDDDWRRVSLGNLSAELTPIEYRLFRTLFEAHGEVLSRSTLLDRVWPPPCEFSEKVVDLHIRRLRAKLAVFEGVIAIQTVRGKGYAMDLSRALRSCSN